MYYEGDLPSDDDYVEDDELDRLLQNAQKRSSMVYLYRRSCVKRGGACDHRPEECCYNSTCRCNLWGANCRCQRKGLFQKWGRK
ncbi:U8-agatoxin-Ao1a isoform X3 [Nilaparvata lugens]|uniref:U8-agatoxin-Ao1a isoform X3 n=1 Tax=Nilaparvata lugens TaxID=108931 RepID=UPI00193E9ECE|nr:U8-agatoxin-Ao1a isoform X3 [Nilaparvata lugens]